MNKIFYIVCTACIFSIVFVSCKSKYSGFSFFVAGHVYGSPYDTAYQIHPPFNAESKFLQAYPNIEFGVFTGDIVRKSVKSNWDSVDVFVKDLGMPVYFAVGNHDEGHKELYAARYGKTYYSWKNNENLFIVLNPLLYGWIINGEQLSFLKEELKAANQFKNIFIFLHQVLWEDPGKNVFGIRPNSYEGRADSINFNSEILPLLQDTQKPVFIFAGDVGATLEHTAIAVSYNENVTFMASGMGSRKNDNYIIVDVDPNGQVKLNLRWMENKAVHQIECCKDIVYPIF
jgi:hypothetical protein